MSTTMIKLRIAGIVSFLLFFISMMLGFETKPGFNFTQIQQILVLVSFVIFAILILLQLYNAYTNTFVNKHEEDSNNFE